MENKGEWALGKTTRSLLNSNTKKLSHHLSTMTRTSHYRYSALSTITNFETSVGFRYYFFGYELDSRTDWALKPWLTASPEEGKLSIENRGEYIGETTPLPFPKWQ